MLCAEIIVKFRKQGAMLCAEIIVKFRKQGGYVVC